jgi:hypothetical protein
MKEVAGLAAGLETSLRPQLVGKEAAGVDLLACMTLPFPAETAPDAG